MRYGRFGRYVAYSLDDGRPLTEGSTAEGTADRAAKITTHFAIIFTSYTKLRPFMKNDSDENLDEHDIQ